MDLQPYVDGVRHELGVAAAAGGSDAHALADRLTAPLDSALRLALLEACPTLPRRSPGSWHPDQSRCGCAVGTRSSPSAPA